MLGLFRVRVRVRVCFKVGTSEKGRCKTEGRKRSCGGGGSTTRRREHFVDNALEAERILPRSISRLCFTDKKWRG